MTGLPQFLELQGVERLAGQQAGWQAGRPSEARLGGLLLIAFKHD